MVFNKMVFGFVDNKRNKVWQTYLKTYPLNFTFAVYSYLFYLQLIFFMFDK